MNDEQKAIWDICGKIDKVLETLNTITDVLEYHDKRISVLEYKIFKDGK